MAQKKDTQKSEGETLQKIMSERADKAAALRSDGHNPYRNDFSPTHTIKQVRDNYEQSKPADDAERQPGINPVDGEIVRVAGRVVAKRGFGKTVFAPIRGPEADIQVFINVDHLDPGDFENIKPKLDAGDILGAEGPVFWTKRGEMSILAKRIFILTKSLRPLPDKWHGLTNVETRYRQRSLDLAASHDVRTVFRKRSQLIQKLRAELDARGFLEVETPMMHPTIGGAAARPFQTHHNALDMRLYMRIAPELYLKRLVVGGFDRVYEINRNFRNEGLSRQHNPEFTMLEFYQAYATYEDLMTFTEELVTAAAIHINDSTKTTWDENEIELGGSWQRLTVRESVTKIGGIAEKELDAPASLVACALQNDVPPPDVWRALALGLPADEVEKRCQGLAGEPAALLGKGDLSGVEAILSGRDDIDVRIRLGHITYLLFEATVEEKLIQPTFITQFPLAVSPLARKNEADPAFVDRFELFVGGREIANAFSELNDPVDQRQRFQAQLDAKAQGADETMDYDEDYCRALELGMPPTAGEGIGIDRLAMLLCGQSSIRDVILFPQMRPEG